MKGDLYARFLSNRALTGASKLTATSTWVSILAIFSKGTCGTTLTLSVATDTPIPANVDKKDHSCAECARSRRLIDSRYREGSKDPMIEHVRLIIGSASTAESSRILPMLSQI